MRRAAVLLLLLTVAALAAGAAAASAADGLRGRLDRALRASGPASGAHVLDVGRCVLFRVRANRPRVMMSNAKLFTTAAALEALGADARFATTAMGASAIGPDGVLDGDLYLRGGG